MNLEKFYWMNEYEDKDKLPSSLKQINDDWTDGPGTSYEEHEHPYDKTLYCLEGSIKFTAAGKEHELKAGEGLRLPKHTPHSAVSGPDGTRCVEVHNKQA